MMNPEPPRSASLSPDSFPKVVVVGAGIAGLVVTKELRRRGWTKDRVVLLEASSTIGGRMRTRRHRSGFLYDAGAAYVHGTFGNPIADLAKEAGIALKQASDNNPWIEGSKSVALYGGGVRATEEERTTTDNMFTELMRRVAARANECDDHYVALSGAVSEILTTEPPFTSMTALEAGRLQLRLKTKALWYGADLEDLQLLEFRNTGDDVETLAEQGQYGDYPGPHCVVDGGVGRLIDALATAEVLECLHLNSRVESVTTLSNSGDSNGTHSPPPPGSTQAGLRQVGKLREWLGLPAPVVTTAGVSISLTDDADSWERGVGAARGSGGVILADAAVVTVPLPLLQQGVIRFDPPLSEEARSSMSRLRMGFYEKIIIEFKEAFWPADAPFIGCCPPTQLAEPKVRQEAEECSVSVSSSPSSPPASRSGHDDVAACSLTDPSGSAVGGEDGTSGRILPVFLENFLWSKGVPVLVTAVSGRRALQMSTKCSSDKKGGVSAPTEGEAPAARAGAAAESRTDGMTVSRLRQKTAVLGRVHTECHKHEADGPPQEKMREEEEDEEEREEVGGDEGARELYRRMVLPALQDAFGRQGHRIPEPVTVTVTGWADEPLQRGSYSFFPTGAREEDIFTAGQGIPAALAGVAAGGGEAETAGTLCRVFLAGEATSVEFEGSMHGAYLSGVRAAADVAYAFGIAL